MSLKAGDRLSHAGSPSQQANAEGNAGKPETREKETSSLAEGSSRKADKTDDSTMGFYVYFKKHWLAVISYCAVFWSFGMCVAFLGPTLLDLGCITASDMKSISWVFFAQLLFSLIGASMSGYLVERCDANYIILVATIVIPICMVLIPLCKALAALAVVLSIMGINMGVIDCLANLQMIKLFGDAVPPFLQAMHFCYGFGAFVSPMIAEPFLLNEDCTPFIDNDTQALSTNGLLEPTIEEAENDTSLPAHSLIEAQTMTKVHYAFWIMAATQIPIPLLVLSLIIRRKLRGISYKHQQLVESDSSPSPTHNSALSKNQYGTIDTETDKLDSVQSKGWCCSPTYYVIVLTVATAAMLFIYDGLQSAYGGYVYSYAVKSIVDLNTTEGAYLNALFWGTFALGRLLSIPLATRFSPACMLLCNVVGSTIALTLMLAFRHDHNALYVGTCMFGLFLSSVAPTALSLAEKFIDLSSKITSIIVVVGAVGEMICPVIVGNIFVSLGPVSFLGFSEAMCLTSIIVFLILWFVGRKSPKYLAKGPSTFVWCQMGYVKPPSRETDVPQVTTQHVKYYHQMSTESSGTIEMTNVKGDTDRNSHDNNWDDKLIAKH